LQEAIKRLHQGSEVSVAGFIGRANSRTGEYRLVVHATAIEVKPQAHDTL